MASPGLPPSPKSIRNCLLFMRVAGAVVMITAGCVLFGWLGGVDRLKTVLAGYPSMKVNTALALLLSGAALALLPSNRKSSPSRLCVAGLGFVVLAIGAPTLSEHLFGWRLGIDQLLVPGAAEAAAPTEAGRMSAATALCITMTGCALVISSQPIPRRLRLPAVASLGTSLALVGSLALAGYTGHILLHIFWWNSTGMAIHTATMFVLVGFALLASVRSEGGIAWVLNLFITAGFAAGVGVMVIAAGVSFSVISRMANAEQWVSHTQEVLKEIQEVMSGMAELESSQRGYIITGDPLLLARRAQTKAAVDGDVKAILTLTADNPRQQRRIGPLHALIEQRAAFGNLTIALRGNGGFPAAAALLSTGTGIRLTNQVQALLNQMRDEEYTLLAQRQSVSKAASAEGFVLLLLGVFLSFTVLSAALFFLNAEVAEHAQAETELRLNAGLFEQAYDAILVWDWNGPVTFWNRAAESLYGFRRTEAVGQTSHELLRTRFPGSKEAVLAILDSEGLWEGELEHTTRDGRVIIAEARLALVRDEARAYVLETIHDITDRKRADQALRESNERLEGRVLERTIELQAAKEKAESADQFKSEFLASMSHELRTPLNGIIGFSEFLIDGRPGPLNPKQKEYLTDVHNSAKHLHDLINDVLDLAKVEAGGMEFHPGRFHVVKAIADVCAVVKGIAIKRGVIVRSSVAPELDEVELDPQKFKQILYNLLSNGVKFTNSGGLVEIIAAPHEGSSLRLQVTDSGIGIRREDFEKLFKRFQQIDSGIGRHYEGTGLGLALTKRIVELQNGSISVESEFGKGSNFTVILPLPPPEAHA